MPPVVIDSFGRGLDLRRSKTSSKPATLLELKNAHIDSGDQIEKRKAMVKIAASSVSAGTFGLASRNGALFTFGSGVRPETLPAAIGYQRLQLVDGYDMTAVLDVERFDGKFYVIAEFGAFGVAHFYDGTLIRAMSGLSERYNGDLDGIAAYFAELINRNSGAFSASADRATLVVKGLPGVPFTVAVGVADFATIDQTYEIVQIQAAATGGPFGALPQATSITFKGTSETGDLWSVRLGGTQFGPINGGATIAISAKALDDKMYTASGSLLTFSAINDPTQVDMAALGAGFINISTTDGGSETITGVEQLNQKLIIFSHDTAQVWTVDPDPANYDRAQTIGGIGAVARRSVVNWQDTDLVFVARQGIRSFRESAFTQKQRGNEIGAPIDKAIRAIPRAELDNAIGLVEPYEGRVWVAIGRRVFVLTQFGTGQIVAWSEYDFGFTIQDWTVSNSTLWVRDTDGNIYVYGGEDGQQYDDCEVTVTTPYIVPGGWLNRKDMEMLAMVSTGNWTVFASFDPRRPDVYERVGIIQQDSTTRQPCGAMREFVALSIRAKHNEPGPATIAEIILSAESGGP